jgi:hypothetical protein
MKNELDIVKDVSEKLAKLGIPFMLTGSLALNCYALARMTRDVDLVVELKPEDLPALLKIFERDYILSAEMAQAAVQRRKSFNLIHRECVIKVDLFVRADTAYGRAAFDRRKAMRMEGYETYVASKEDLIISKLEWAKDSRSEVQLGDVRNLLATGYDEKYVLDWTKKLGLERLLQECLRG